MGRISQYPLDTDIQGDDKWIGTSVSNANATKNFSVDNVVEYINKSAGVESQALRYTYQNVQGDDVRLASTISFATSLGDNVPFEDITEWVISAYSKQIKDVRTYYEAPLVGNTILITNAFNPSNWAIFRWDSVTEDIDDPNFYNIELTHIQSTGELVANQDYLIALLDAASGGSAIWGGITGLLSNQTDLQNALNAKQASLVSGTNIKTINSTTLLGSGDITVQPTLVSGTNIKTINSTSLLGSGNIVINTPPSGVSGAIQFSDGSAFSSDATKLFWDNTNKRLGVGTNVPSARLDVKSQGALFSDFAFRIRNSVDTADLFLVRGTGTVEASQSLSASQNITAGSNLLGQCLILSSTNPQVSGGAVVYGSTITNTSSQKIINLTPTYNQASGTASNTDIFVNRTTTLVGSGLQYLMDLQSNGVSRLNVTPNGNIGIGETSPTARLQVKGSGTTSATQSFKAENSTATASLTLGDDGVSTFGFPTGGKVLIAGGVGSGDTLLEIRRTSSSSGGFLFRSGNASSQEFWTTNGGMYLGTPDGSDIALYPGLGKIILNTQNRDMTAINTGHQIILGQRAGSSLNRWLEYGYNGIYGNILQSAQNGTTPSGDTLSLNPFGGNVGIGNTLANAAAKLDVFSTTQGFLPPRMTNAQILAIASPVNGLMAYNTTIGHLCVYQAGAWVKISHSPM